MAHVNKIKEKASKPWQAASVPHEGPQFDVTVINEESQWFEIGIAKNTGGFRILIEWNV